MIKKYKLLLTAFIIVLMLTSTNTAQVVLVQEKVQNNLPENSLIRKNIDGIVKLLKFCELLKDIEIDISNANQNGWNILENNIISKEFESDVISPSAPEGHIVQILIKYDKSGLFITNIFGIDDANPRNFYSLFEISNFLGYSQEFLENISEEIKYNMNSETEPLPSPEGKSSSNNVTDNPNDSDQNDSPNPPPSNPAPSNPPPPDPEPPNPVPPPDPNPPDSEEYGIVSGRIFSNDYLMTPLYDASVLINGKPAEILGSTYLALNVTLGEITIEASDSIGNTLNEIHSIESTDVNSINLIFPEDISTTPPEVETSSDHLLINWQNGIRLELNLLGDRILGIGAVKINDISLRQSEFSGLPTIEKLVDNEYVRINNEQCLYQDYETLGETVIIHSLLETNDGTLNLDWIFTPWDLTVEENQYNGIGYRFSISSPLNLSKLSFRCSWELNEDIDGKTLLTRRRKAEWETVCTQSESIQIISPPLLVQSQPPTYQYDDSGALASFIWPPIELENTLQKDAGSNQLWFSDKFSFGENNQVDTSFRVILYSNNKGINEYTYLFDHISEKYRMFYGFEEVELLPTVLSSSYLKLGAPPGEAPPYRTVADNQIPEFAEASFKRTTILSVWDSNGRIGDPYNGNRLATHDIEVYSEDVDELSYFINKIHDSDMELTAWLSTCFSKESPLFESNDWQIQNIDGSYPSAQSGDVYLMSYRSSYLAYALEKLEKLQSEFTFDGLWHDSFTAGFMIDYSHTPTQPPIDQQLQFLSATQQLGYIPFTESLGPFGMTAVGSIAVTPPDSPRGDRDMNAAFGGREYLAYKTSFTLWHEDDYSPLQIDYYRFIANKALPMIAYIYLDETEKNTVSRANEDYINAMPYMDKRHLLSNDNGVLWYDTESDTQILFSFNAFTYDIDENINEIFDITSNSVVEAVNGSITTQQNHTYRLQ